MRVTLVLLLAALAACNRGAQSDEAVRQGVIDHLAKAGLNVQGMDVKVTSVERNGAEANASVSIAPKGASGQPMAFKYNLKQQGSRWVVVGRDESGSPHSGAPPAAAGSPPGATPGAGGKMPDPSALPPSSPKK